MVKTFQDIHTCFKDGRCKILLDSCIAKLFLNELREDPEMKPKAIQEQIQLRYDLNPSDDQCRKAKKRKRRRKVWISFKLSMLNNFTGSRTTKSKLKGEAFT